MYNEKTVISFSIRQDTSENWISVNPILKRGEFGIEHCNEYMVKFKIGNGVDPWLDLKYLKIKDDKRKKSNNGLIISIFTVLNAVIVLANLLLLSY